MKNKDSSLALLIYSLSAGGFLCLAAATCGLIGSVQLAAEGFTEGLAALAIIVLGTAWCAVLLLPGAWHAMRDLQGECSAEEAARPSRLSGMMPYLIALLAYPAVLFLGYQAAETWWALPFLHILAATIPVYALSGLALHRLEPGSGPRRWGVFGVGLTLGPGLILILEAGLIILVGIGFTIRISSEPARAMELMLLAQRLQYAQADPQIILGILQPYLNQPLFLFGIAAFISIFVPLIEELLKPIGVWLLAGRDLTPAGGFSAGVLSGAGYALFENLFITAPGSEWAIVSIGRVGTTTMHLLTAGITGYALASAWKQARYLRLGMMYFLALLIHAIWNALTILSVASALPASLDALQWAKPLEQVAPGGLLVFYLAVLAGLIYLNRRLRTPEQPNHAIIPAP